MTRHIVYQFGSYTVTYDKNTEQDRIDAVEAAQKYISKADVTIEEREDIDDGAWVEIAGGELVVENAIYHTAPGSLLPQEPVI